MEPYRPVESIGMAGTNASRASWSRFSLAIEPHQTTAALESGKRGLFWRCAVKLYHEDFPALINSILAKVALSFFHLATYHHLTLLIVLL
jgi:hypothetical protein